MLRSIRSSTVLIATVADYTIRAGKGVSFELISNLRPFLVRKTNRFYGFEACSEAVSSVNLEIFQKKKQFMLLDLDIHISVLKRCIVALFGANSIFF